MRLVTASERNNAEKPFCRRFVPSCFHRSPDEFSWPPVLAGESTLERNRIFDESVVFDSESQGLSSFQSFGSRINVKFRPAAEFGTAARLAECRLAFLDVGRVSECARPTACINDRRILGSRIRRSLEIRSGIDLQARNYISRERSRERTLRHKAGAQWLVKRVAAWPIASCLPLN